MAYRSYQVDKCGGEARNPLLTPEVVNSGLIGRKELFRRNSHYTATR